MFQNPRLGSVSQEILLLTRGLKRSVNTEFLEELAAISSLLLSCFPDLMVLLKVKETALRVDAFRSLGSSSKRSLQILLVWKQ